MKLTMTLHKRLNGIFYVVYRDYQKKQVWKSLGTKDASMAKRLYSQFKKAYLEGRITKIEDAIKSVTFSDFCSEFLSLSEASQRNWTYKTYTQVLNKFSHFIGDQTLLKTVTLKTIDSYIIHARSLGNSAETINKDLRHLHSAFSKAVEYGYINQNPVSNKSKLRLDKRPPKSISPDDFHKLMSYIDVSDFRNFVYFVVYTGCRRQEALNLTWSDVHCDDGYIEIVQAKSHEFRRIPISDKLSFILDQIGGNVGKLFPWTYDFVGRKFKEYSVLSGVPCTLHSLRHTFATILANSETPLKVLQDLMGHKSITSTMCYITALDDKKQDAVNRIDL